MYSRGKSKCAVETKRFIQKEAYGEVCLEVESDDRRKGLWQRALQKSRGDESKACVLYNKYKTQLIEAEVATAKTLLSVSSTDIIQSYMTKMKYPDSQKTARPQSRPCELATQNNRKKKCYKCGKKVFLDVKPCPVCRCNSFVFCR